MYANIFNMKSLGIDPSLRTGNQRRILRRVALLVAPLVLVAACSKDSSGLGAEDSVTPTTTPTSIEEIAPSRADDCDTGSPGLDSLITGRSYSIRDEGATETRIEHFGGFEVEGEWRPEISVIHTSMSDAVARQEGWEFVANKPDGSQGSGLFSYIDTLQCAFGLDNVTTGDGVNSAGDAVGMPGLVSVWIRRQNPEDLSRA